ncbi:MAG: EamA family transporter [Bryobacterales bacterium]|nr:EamA family transporter [Bryobacterales bacterium]
MRGHPHFKAYVALAAVCVFWGTTYLGIRIALESFPPVAMVSARFTLSGAIMLAGALAARARLPVRRELRQTALNGVLILGVGNCCLTVAELWIPSGLAALIITTSPLWMVGIDALLPGGDRLRRPALAGILVGCLGAVLLVLPQAGAGGASGSLVWAVFLLLQCASLSWSYGSIRQRRIQASAHPVVNGAVQQLAAGLAFMPLALLQRGASVHWNLKGVLAVLYLVVFGSIVGYSAYVYALNKLPVALVSIYVYINPIVAVFLGWLFYREPFGAVEAAGMGVIFLGVALVKRYSPAPTAVEVD